MDLFGDTAAVLNATVSNSYYGMLRGQIGMYLPPEHPIIAGAITRSVQLPHIPFAAF